jgi:choline dehydrogenase
VARPTVPPTITAAYDHVIVGGGTAGCIVAARLSEQPGCRVLLVEAGGMDTTRPTMVDPSLWRDNWRTDADWLYHTVPQAGLDSRVVEWNRGKVIGGSSTINAMAWVWGQAADFDGWAAAGNPGWDFASLLPVFQRMERCLHAGNGVARGRDGAMEIFSFSARDPLIAAYLETCRAAGHAVHEDSCGPTRAGAAPAEMTLRPFPGGGQRFSVAQAYLQPVLGRDNLTVLADTEIDSLMFDGTRCIGIRCRVAGESREVRSLRDVVLTAGVIETPHLLLLAGIGPNHDLRRLGIGVRADLAGVGGNLHDHCQLAAVVAEAPSAGRSPRPLAHLFVASGAGRPGLDLCITLAQSTAAPASAPSGRGFALLVGLFRPDSRGRLSLMAAERHAPLQIDPRYLAESADFSALCKGVRQAAELANATAFAPWRIGEPKGPTADDADLYDFVRHRTGTYRHPVGTCAMGTGPDSVVDASLRVHGITNLRIADNSIMPRIPVGHTMAATMAIAEKAADLMAAAGSR